MREFRALHEQFQAAGVAIAGVSTDSVESCREWAQKLQLPYPLLSDARREAGRAFHVMREFGIGGWKIDLFKRTTFLADREGIIRAIWSRVGVRRHAREVLRFAKTLETGSVSPSVEPAKEESGQQGPASPSAPPA